MSKTKVSLASNLLIALFLLSTTSVRAQDEDCKSLLLIEPVSGAVIYEKNADEKLSPASVVKLMNAYVVLEHLKQGTITKDETVTVSAFASKIGGSQVYLSENEEFTVDQLFEAMMVQSANDAATALAEHIAGSSEAYVQMMNEAAQKLGMKDSEFHSPHGLPPGKGQLPDMITAKDILLLARVLLIDHPELLEYSSKTNATFRDGTFAMSSPNHLLKNFPGADGLKTGYYAQAGFSIVATAKKNDVRMLAAVLGCAQRLKRDAEAKRLLSQGLAQYKVTKLASKDESLEEEVPVVNGTKKSVQVQIKKDVSAIVKTKDLNKIKRIPNLCKEVVAPLSGETPCGTLSFVLDGETIASTPLVINGAVDQLNFAEKIGRFIGIN